MTTVLTNATIVTVDPDDTVIHGGAIVIDGEHITAVGPAATVLADLDDPEPAVLDLEGAIVHPGLINAHTHLAMTLFRGYADDVDLQGFLDLIVPAEGELLDADSVRAGSALAVAESVRAGGTAALDMYFWPEVTDRVAAAAGFTVATGPVFVGFPGPDSMDFPTRRQWAEGVLAEGGRWLAPHSTYTLEPDQLRVVAELSDRFGARVHVHASENQAEVDLVRDRHGRSPIRVLDDTGLLHERTVLAHAVALDDGEIARIASTGAIVAHCPLSNLKLASGICRVPDLLEAGVCVALGTDGCASSNDLDLYGAMRTAALLHKGVRRDATVLPAATVLRMATVNGARALGRHDLGSIEAGKRADLVLLDPEAPALTPSFDPVATIVYAATRAEVHSVWCAGRRVVEAGRVTGLDVAAARRAVTELGRRIAGHRGLRSGS